MSTEVLLVVTGWNWLQDQKNQMCAYPLLFCLCVCLGFVWLFIFVEFCVCFFVFFFFFLVIIFILIFYMSKVWNLEKAEIFAKFSLHWSTTKVNGLCRIRIFQKIFSQRRWSELVSKSFLQRTLTIFPAVKREKTSLRKFTDFIQTLYSSWSNDLFYQSLEKRLRRKIPSISYKEPKWNWKKGIKLCFCKLKPEIKNSLSFKAVQFYTQTLWLGFFSTGKIQRSSKRKVQNMMICFSSVCGHYSTL